MCLLLLRFCMGDVFFALEDLEALLIVFLDGGIGKTWGWVGVRPMFVLEHLAPFAKLAFPMRYSLPPMGLQLASKDFVRSLLHPCSFFAMS